MYEVVGDPPSVPPLYLGVVEEGDAPGSSLPHGVLASSQWPVGAFLRPPIVRHEDDGSVVKFPGRLQCEGDVLDSLV